MSTRTSPLTLSLSATRCYHNLMAGGVVEVGTSTTVRRALVTVAVGLVEGVVVLALQKSRNSKQKKQCGSGVAPADA